MIHIKENISLKKYNTFGIDVIARTLVEFSSSDDLVTFLENNGLPSHSLILGGGSNYLFTGDFGGTIFYPVIPGIDIVDSDNDFVFVEAGAGVVWDALVEYAVGNGFGGIENLSAIPGNVGASPVQNIGAYGSEAQETINCVKGIDLETGKELSFSAGECKFAYRDSVFKHEWKGRFLVTSVIFRLHKVPTFNLEYGALRSETEKYGEVSLSNIRKAVISIRDSKLPNPLEIGNAGSFFKNPIVSLDVAEELKTKWNAIPIYETDCISEVKIAAGWLIDQCGWRGYRQGDAGVNKDQALVLVNYGKATGAEIVSLAETIQNSVFEKFGISLEPEVNIIC
jgi:UDP-N-acetylmuramate dehydrogenase